MFLGKVIGKLIATKKDDKLEGAKFLIVQPTDYDQTPKGPPIVAIDIVQSGLGDFVYLVKSREAAIPWHIPGAPVDAAIVGLVDKTETILRPTSHGHESR